VAIGIDQEVALLPGHGGGDVGEHQVGHLVMGDQAVAGGEVDPLRPFGL
jgi:hypothetical protein